MVNGLDLSSKCLQVDARCYARLVGVLRTSGAFHVDKTSNYEDQMRLVGVKMSSAMRLLLAWSQEEI